MSQLQSCCDATGHLPLGSGNAGVGRPRALTGASVAKIWSSALGREIAYGGDDVAAFEKNLASYGPTWLAYDMSLMMAGIQKFGMHAAEGTVERLETIIGHPLRTYEDFVREAIAQV